MNTLEIDLDKALVSRARDRFGRRNSEVVAKYYLNFIRIMAVCAYFYLLVEPIISDI
jgi:hypothetical protein